MWDWMNQESQKPHVHVASPYNFFTWRHDWRTAAFRGLVEAKAHLATDHSLDAALETYFRGTKVPYYFSTQAAANFCHRALGQSRSRGTERSYEQMRRGLAFTKTSPRLWDAFYNEIGKRPLRFSEQLQAMMQPYHPQHPNPWPMFEWWRKAEEDQTHPLHRVESRTSMLKLLEVCRDIRLVLNHQGNHKAAQLLKAFPFEVFPEGRVYSRKPRRERQSVDGKPLPSHYQSRRLSRDISSVTGQVRIIGQHFFGPES